MIITFLTALAGIVTIIVGVGALVEIDYDYMTWPERVILFAIVASLLASGTLTLYNLF